MHLTLTGKRALVCGATQGIGLAAAKQLAGMGADVTLFARDEAKLQSALKELPGAGKQPHAYLVADFNDPSAVAEAAQAYVGVDPVHILVNNSGGPPGGPVEAAKIDEFEVALRRHLFANHLLAQTVLPGMKAAGFGRIINVVSTSVYEPIKGLGVSNTTRAAVAGWAKTLSAEVAGARVTVNNVLPGATLTGRLRSIIEKKAEKNGVPYETAEAEMLMAIPAGRFAQPEEVASAIAFLASQEAAYITGVSLAVDGGRMSGI